MFFSWFYYFMYVYMLLLVQCNDSPRYCGGSNVWQLVGAHYDQSVVVVFNLRVDRDL